MSDLSDRDRAELAQQAALPLLAETVKAEVAERLHPQDTSQPVDLVGALGGAIENACVDRIAEVGAIILDEDPDGPQVEPDPTPVRPGREPAPELDDRFKASPLLYPNGTYATIKVRYGDSHEWPVVERAQGAWQSGAHRYNDDAVEAVRVLPVNGQVVLTDEMVEIAVAGIVGSSWKFVGPDARKATLEDGYTALQAALAAEPVTVPRKTDGDGPRWADLFGMAPDITAGQLFGEDSELAQTAPRPMLDAAGMREHIRKGINAALFNGGHPAASTGWSPSEEVDSVTKAVMEMARPMPTRDELFAVLTEFYYGGVGDRRDYTYKTVDAVLALLTGTAK